MSNTSPLIEGTVYRKITGRYDVHTGSAVLPCTLSPRLRKELSAVPQPEGMKKHRNGNLNGSKQTIQASPRWNHTYEHTDPVAIGDVVRVETLGSEGQIVEILPRANRLARRTAVPMPDTHAFEQVIVANLDQVVPVFAAANPAPHWGMLDRYLVSAESSGLPSLIVITKADLAREPSGELDAALRQAAGEYRAVGYPVIFASAFTGEGLSELRRALMGRASAFLGKSGVGKTSLLNALQPGLGLRVNAVNEVTGKGRHTTTHLEMFPLDFGGAVVDTPGVREFGLWELHPDELADLFPEMRPFLGQCRFGFDCTHDEEPGCAVRKAVMAGHISPRRYQSFTKLRDDL